MARSNTHKSSITAAYRFQVALRLLAALIGGYLLANAAAILLARVLAFAITRADGVLIAAMVSFAVYLGAVLWAFAARSAQRAWAGLLTVSAVCGASAWLLGGGAAA